MDYQILGVSSNASFSEIKRAWRELCKQYHPDNPTGDAEKFREINEAYKRITDNINSKTIQDDEYEHTVDFQGILDDYIKYAFSKYKYINLVVGYLETFLSGNYNGITRDNNFRNLFQEYLTPEIVRNIVGGNLSAYVQGILANYDPAYDAFMEACKATFVKYGKDQLAAALNEALKGNYSMFTNDGRGLRDRLSQLVNTNDILQFLTNIIGYENLDPSIPLGNQAVDKMAGMFTRNEQGRDPR